MKITDRDIPPRAAWTLEQAGVHPLLARLYAARGIVQRDFTTSPFVVAAAFYLLMTLVLTWAFQRMEKKVAVYD